MIAQRASRQAYTPIEKRKDELGGREEKREEKRERRRGEREAIVFNRIKHILGRYFHPGKKSLLGFLEAGMAWVCSMVCGNYYYQSSRILQGGFTP